MHLCFYLHILSTILKYSKAKLQSAIVSIALSGCPLLRQECTKTDLSAESIGWALQNVFS